ncbi:bifunctional metallophosphatase/5'-nucleotidase, partial [Lactobacillus sp. XV13L]|nr:bifunctional metallophosphatase/5'-nucleotidase [Lactobacillus sp. XV13L]
MPQLQKQADIIVVAYHGGFERDLQTNEPTETLTGENEGSQLLQEVPGIDALVTGHQHRALATTVHGIPITQPGYQGRYVGEIDIEVNSQKQIINQQAQLHEVEPADLEPALQHLAAPLQQEVQTWLDQILGQVNGDMTIDNPLQARLHHHPYLEFINQVQMQATNTDIAGTALFNDNIRGFNHDVILRNILTSYPFANTLAVEVITGAELKAALEQAASYFAFEEGQVQVAATFLKPKVQHYNYDVYSGIDYEFDLRQPVGHRVVKLQYHG